jgi:hypothetical protein
MLNHSGIFSQAIEIILILHLFLLSFVRSGQILFEELEWNKSPLNPQWLQSQNISLNKYTLRNQIFI